MKKKVVEVQNEALENTTRDDTENTVRKKCRYYNGGYCKRKSECRFVHPEQICEETIQNKKCESNDCQKRHPKRCKWMSSKSGCHRVDCKYLHDHFANEERHVNLVNAKQQNSQEYECISCKCVWKDRKCVVEHVVQKMKVYFCLNCDDWVQNKTKVLQSGWTLLDEAGDLRTDV